MIKAEASAMSESTLRFPIKKRRKKIRVRRTVFICLMLSVAIINFLVFWVYINASSIIMAFQQVVNNETIITLGNFKLVLNEIARADSHLRVGFINTLKYFTLSLCGILPLSIIFSYFLFKKVFMWKYFRVVFFLPNIISAVIMVILYKNIIAPNGPIVQILVKFFGVDPESPPVFLGEIRYATNAILIYTIWTGFGLNLVLLNGAMSRVPDSVVEYGKLEGVTLFRELFSVMIPMIWPTISTLLIFSFVGLFAASGPILLFNAMEQNTRTISYWIYEQVIGRQYNIASAVGLMCGVIGLPIALTAKYLLEKVNADVEY